MLKSRIWWLASLAIAGLVLLAAGSINDNAPSELYTVIVFVGGMLVLPCCLLFWRDSYQEAKLKADRKADALKMSSDPLLAAINSEETLAFRPVFTAPPSEFFTEKWFINSTTFDYNTSIMAVKLKSAPSEKTLYRELNRVARAACGGWFLRTQVLAVLIFSPPEVEISAASLVSSHFLGRTGILWVFLIKEDLHSVSVARFNAPTRLDPVYSRILGWFSSRGYLVNVETIK